jgi:hypothetical protein
MTTAPAQVKEARRLLGWTCKRLAGESGLSPAIIWHLETGNRWATAARLSSIRCALEDVGVEFIADNGEGPGVRLRERGGPVMHYGGRGSAGSSRRRPSRWRRKRGARKLSYQSRESKGVAMSESLNCRSGKMSVLAIFALICAGSAAYAGSAAHGPPVASANTAWSEPVPQCSRRDNNNDIVDVPCRPQAPTIDATVQPAVPEARL